MARDVIDLHSHYPMHILAADPGIAPPVEASLPEDLPGRLQRVVLRIANEAANYPNDGRRPAVTGETLHQSPIRIALSVLYIPFDEMDLDKAYGSPPAARYFADLRDLLLEVNAEAAGRDRDHVTVARNLADTRAIAATGRTALIHAVEGGFHLGNAAEIDANVTELAGLGVAYITVAHLFWRQVATNAPAIPFLPDQTYDTLFPQPGTGLAELGRTLVSAMARNGILVDLSHMTREAIADTLALLDAIDPTHGIPVMATHAGCRAIHDAEYNLHDDDIRAIMRRDGVIGLIASSHWMSPHSRQTGNSDETMAVLASHIDHIEKLATGDGRPGHHFVAIGSDLDGFIKPPLAGLEFPTGYTAVASALEGRYGEDAAGRICFGNAERVLQHWRVRP